MKQLSRKYFDRLDAGNISTKELLNASEVNGVDHNKYKDSEFMPKIRFPEVFLICLLLLDIRLWS